MQEIIDILNLCPPIILLPIDASPHSAAAVNLMTLITWPAGTRIHVLAMVPGCLPPAGFSLTAHNVSRNETKAATRQPALSAAVRMAAQVADSLETQNITVDTEVCEGRPTQLIAERAMKLMANMIVIGARGQTRADPFRLGEVSQRIVKCAACSVLLVE